MYHPDKNKDEGAADLFRKVQGAYEVVGGDGRRKYDSELLTQRFRYR
jgi:DnaJ-class molecular chaperone